MIWPVDKVQTFLDTESNPRQLYGLAVIDIDYMGRFCLRFDSAEISRIVENIHAYLRISLPQASVWRSRDDEFLVVYPGMSRADLALGLSGLKKAFKKEKFAKDSLKSYSNVTMTFSAGVACFPDDGNTLDEVIRKATVGLFLAKSRRRDRVCEAPDPHCSGLPRTLIQPDGEVDLVIGQYGEIGYLHETRQGVGTYLWEPQAIDIDDWGNLYITDQNNHCILKYDGVSVNAVAGCGSYGYCGDGGLGPQARLNKPTGMAIHGNYLYITDTGNDAVRRLDLASLRIETVAGMGEPGYSGDGGPAVLAKLNKPGGAAVDRGGGLYINDIANNVIRRVDGENIITCYAGTGEYGYTGDGGPAENATFAEIYGLCAGNQPGDLYLADYFNHCIRKIEGATGLIHTVAGSGQCGYSGDGGHPLQACLDRPVAVCVDKYDNLFIAESGNSCIRVLLAASKRIYTLVGDGACGIGQPGPVGTFRLANPNGLAMDNNRQLYILDGANNRVCKIDLYAMYKEQRAH